MEIVLHTWPNGRFVQLQDGFRSKETMGPIWEPTFLEPALVMDCIYIYGFQSIDQVKVKPSKQKLVSSGNSMSYISTGIKRGSLKELKESSFVLVALNVTSHLSPHSTLLCKSNSSSPADSTFLKKQTYQDWNREWHHLHRSLFLIEPHREDQ